MDKHNKKIYEKPVFALAVFGTDEIMAVSGGIASGGRLKISDGAKSIDVDNLK